MYEWTLGYFDESGTSGDDLYFGMGLLKIKTPLLLNDKLTVIKMSKDFNQEVKSSQASELRFSVEKLWIDEFFKQDAKFCCLIAKKTDFDMSYFGNKEWVRFNKVMKDFLVNNINDGEVVHVFADSKPLERDDNLQNYIPRSIPTLGSFQFLDSKEFNLIQLCDLLLGTVRAEFEKKATARWKITRRDYLRSLLKVNTLERSINFSNFNVWPYKPRKR